MRSISKYGPGSKEFEGMKEIYQKEGTLNSAYIKKKLGIDQTIYSTVLSHFIKDIQKLELDIMEDDKINASEKVKEIFSPPPEEEKDLPPISHKDLLLFEENEIKSPYAYKHI